eukprot:jgi/Ulvmu1/12117/UM084_0043.1
MPSTGSTECKALKRLLSPSGFEDPLLASPEEAQGTAGRLSPRVHTSAGPGHLSHVTTAPSRAREVTRGDVSSRNRMAVQSDTRQCVHSLSNGGHAQLASLLDSIANLDDSGLSSGSDLQQTSATLMIEPGPNQTHSEFLTPHKFHSKPHPLTSPGANLSNQSQAQLRSYACEASPPAHAQSPYTRSSTQPVQFSAGLASDPDTPEHTTTHAAAASHDPGHNKHAPHTHLSIARPLDSSMARMNDSMAKHEMAVDRVTHQSCRKEINTLKQQVREQQDALQSCAESMVALQEQLKREQLERQQGERQQGELRAWLDDLRLERQRLEERLLAGAARGAQETRSDLEAAVQRLSRDKAALGSEVAALQLEQQQQNEFLGSRQALEAQVRALEERLRKQRGARQQLEDHLKSLFRDYQAVRADAEGLRQRGREAEEEKGELRGRLHECERCLVSLQERVNAKMALVAQVRQAADALMHDNTDKAAELAEAARSRQRLEADVERAQQAAQQQDSDLAELALALDLADSVAGIDGSPARGVVAGAPPCVGTMLKRLERIRSERQVERAELSSLRQQQVQAGTDIAEARAESKSAAAELLQLHREVGEARSAQHAQAQQQRHEVEAATARAQEAEGQLQRAKREAEALEQDKRDLGAAVQQLQADLEAEHRLNEEMHDILATFRRQHSDPE